MQIQIRNILKKWAILMFWNYTIFRSFVIFLGTVSLPLRHVWHTFLCLLGIKFKIYILFHYLYLHHPSCSTKFTLYNIIQVKWDDKRYDIWKSDRERTLSVMELLLICKTVNKVLRKYLLQSDMLMKFVICFI